MTVLAGGVVSAHDGPTEPLPAIERGLRDVLHTPPSLVRQGNRVELRYDVVCQADAFGKPCALNGNVFVRSAREGGYRAVRLARAGEAALAATVDVPAGALVLRRHRRRRRLDHRPRGRRCRSATGCGLRRTSRP